MSAAGEPPTIAVFPFSNLSSDPEQVYFVQGMADEIVSALARIRSLLVISSKSSAALEHMGWMNKRLRRGCVCATFLKAA